MEKMVTSRIKNVGINDAIQETFAWRQIMKPFMKDNLLRGFFIPIEDVKRIAEMHNVEGMRGYFCLKTPGDFSSISFLVVPVADDGKDIITKHSAEEEGDSTIYDFTRPCPEFCDTTSPLY